MTTIIATSVMENRGKARIWLEGEKLIRGQFDGDSFYNLSFKDGVLKLRHSATGQRKVSERRGKPIIDLCNKEIASWYPIGTKLRAVVRRGVIIIRRAVQCLKNLKRAHRIVQKIATGTPLNIVSMFHGGGVMDRAIHVGLKKAGVKVRASVVAELEGKYLDASMRANADLFDENTVFFNGPVQDFELGRVVAADVFIAGVPCSGASTAGRASRGLSSAEAHPEAGALFFTTLEWIKRFEPGLVVLENVKPYQSTASMTVIRSLLGSWGYDVKEAILNGCDFGALENRDRLVVVAIAKGLKAENFDIASIIPTRTKPSTLAEILEPIAEDDERYKPYAYLEEKAIRDKAAGKGFRRQIFTADSESVNTITKDYNKARSTDPFLQHPKDSSLTRLFTVIEHARIKGIPEDYVNALKVSTTTAHQILGQSVIYPVFEAVGYALGHFLKTLQFRLIGSPSVAPQQHQLELVA